MRNSDTPETATICVGMHLRVACGITLYNPGSNIVDYIRKYSSIFVVVIVYDNTPGGINSTIRNAIENCGNVFLLGRGRNDGLSFAFNCILEAVGDSCDFLCMMDQDSDFAAIDIWSLIAALPRSDERFAIICPHIIYNWKQQRKFDKFIVVRYAITSGSFVRLRTITDLGIRFDENYFIDKFEIDLCRQLQRAGYYIVEYRGSQLFQQLGEPSGHKHPNHNSLRHYYLFRNRLYFNKKFHSIVSRWLLNIAQTTRHQLSILLFEDDKIHKMTQMFPAIFDYSRGRMGARGRNI